MRFTAETRGCLKCKISSRLTRNGGRTYGRTLYGQFSQNQNFWDAWNTITLGAPLSAVRVRESSAITSRKEFWVNFPSQIPFQSRRCLAPGLGFYFT